MHIRRISSRDRSAVDELLTTAPRLSVQVPWHKLPDLLFQEPTFVVEQAGEIGCIFGVTIEPERVARLHVFALRAGWSTTETLAVLLPDVLNALQRLQIEIVAHLGTENWLIEALVHNGFERGDTIITMQKTEFSVPTTGNTEITVRPAGAADLHTLVEIDRVAFSDPLWHHTTAGLSKLYREAAFMIVAGEEMPVGYAYGEVIGRHGHLSRIAVHPAWQGRQLGVRLLAESIAHFKARHVFGITLNTQSDNTRARRLYEWFGFQVLGVEAYVLKRAVSSPLVIDK